MTNRLCKPFLLIVLHLTSALAGLAVAPVSTEDVLRMLDADVARRTTYIRKREQQIDQLKQLLARTPALARFEVCDEICQGYVGLNADSMRHYGERCLEYARDPQSGSAEKLQKAIISQAQSYATNGLYEQAKTLLLPMHDNLYPANRLAFYKTMSLLLSWESDFSTLPNAFEQAKPRINACLDSIVKYETDPVFKVHQRAILKGYEDQRLALQITLPILDTISLDNPNLRFVANNAATSYEVLGIPDSARYYLALSAMSDLRQGVLEHASLPHLSAMLFAKGDIDRAYSYMRCSVEDAEACGARLRTIQMAEEVPIILDAYQSKINAQNGRLRRGLIVLALLLAGISGLFVLFFYTFRRLRRARQRELAYHDDLRRSKLEVEQALRQVRQTNSQLKESNQIKETYVTQYMKQCSASIAKIEAYRLSLQKTALSSNYGKLLETIKDTRVIDKELDEFYRSFDETFLSLFPTFKTDFNALLRPEEQLPEGEAGRLSTELRIFALIRLGITDSEEIANFLRYSVKTIYNYRTKMRNKALGDRNLLEHQLMDIGIIGS